MWFQEALVQLKAGKNVYRKGWNPQDGYLTFMPGMSHVWKIVLSPTPNAGNYIYSVEDLSANDWDIFTIQEPPCGDVIELSGADEAKLEEKAA